MKIASQDHFNLNFSYWEWGQASRHTFKSSSSFLYYKLSVQIFRLFLWVVAFFLLIHGRSLNTQDISLLSIIWRQIIFPSLSFDFGVFVSTSRQFNAVKIINFSFCDFGTACHSKKLPSPPPKSIKEFTHIFFWHLQVSLFSIFDLFRIYPGISLSRYKHILTGPFSSLHFRCHIYHILGYISGLFLIDVYSFMCQYYILF